MVLDLVAISSLSYSVGLLYEKLLVNRTIFTIQTNPKTKPFARLGFLSLGLGYFYNHYYNKYEQIDYQLSNYYKKYEDFFTDLDELNSLPYRSQATLNK